MGKLKVFGVIFVLIIIELNICIMDNMSMISTTLEFYSSVQRKLSEQDFSVFKMSNYFWLKFSVTCESDLLKFYGHLDTENEKIFCKLLEQKFNNQINNISHE